MPDLKHRTERFAADYLARTTLNPAFLKGVENMLDTQSKLLDSFQEALSGWMNRRRDAIRDAQSSLDRMRRCKDIAEVFQVQQDWMTGEARRMTDDANAFGNAMMAFSRTATHEMEQAQRTLDEAGRRFGREIEEAGQEMLKAAGDKPAAATGTRPAASAAQ